MTEATVRQRVNAWLRLLVVGEGLCPFAARPLREGRVHVEVCCADEPQGIYRHVLTAMDALLQLPSEQRETTVVAVPNGLADFDDYLDMLADLDDALEQAGLRGILQIASFHPNYCFADSSPDDLANFSNRSPYPLFHLLREASLDAVLQGHARPEAIPQRNQAHLRALGEARIRALLQAVEAAAAG